MTTIKGLYSEKGIEITLQYDDTEGLKGPYIVYLKIPEKHVDSAFSYPTMCDAREASLLILKQYACEVAKNLILNTPEKGE